MSRINFITLFFASVLFFQCSTDRFDLVIKNGNFYDGAGNASVKADIGIKDGIITEINKNLSIKGAILIDASNLIVAPGFIDIHTHCDGQILNDGMNSLENYLTQGVTTVVTGSCGSGTYKVDKFFDQLDSIGTGTNIVHLVGHNEIRSEVMGMDNREPTEAELEEMKKMLRIAMEGGAMGFSTGLFYTPGAYSSTSEIIELAKVVKEYDGFYSTHIRDESNYTVGLEEAVKEAVSIGEQTGIRVQISHIKALGKPVWGMSSKICTLIENAKEKGVCVFADQYPYNASSTGLASAIVPSWARAGGKLETNLQDPELLPEVKREIAENIDRRGGPGSLVIVAYPNDRRFDGKSLLDISRIINKTAVETAIDLILEGYPSIVSFNMKDTDIINFMTKDYVMTCSDGHIEIPGDNKPHPRNYGAFTRKIRKYVIEDKLISMEHAIKSATSLPADMIGLQNRGYLKEGCIADIVIFDPTTIRDLATFNEPHQYSRGIEYLLINGDAVIKKGQYNGKLAGKPISISN